MFRLIVDERERHLIAFFRELKIQIEVRTLDLGDIIITNSNDRASSSEIDSAASKLLSGSSKNEIKDNSPDDGKDISPITITIERKRFTDIKSSMNDGRYHEQKKRYLQLPRGTIFYILEDDDPRFESLEQSSFHGMYAHTVIRDNIGVFRTESLSETAQLILKIKNTIEEFGLDYRDKIPSCGLESTQIKKKRVTGSDIYLQQLACFPGINKTKANAIAKIYPNISLLIEALKANTFKVKGIGPVLMAGMKSGLILDT